jgi:hypothetical protein
VLGDEDGAEHDDEDDEDGAWVGNSENVADPSSSFNPAREPGRSILWAIV